MSCGQRFSRVPERKFRYDRQQIKRRMIWCQLSWLSRRVIGPWKLLCPVSKVKEELWSLVIFFHFLILLLPLFAPLLHLLLPLGAVGSDDGLYHPSWTSLFRCAQSRSGTRTSCSRSQRAREQTETGTHGWMDRWTSYLSLLLLSSTSLFHNPGRIKPLLPPPTPFSLSVHPSILFSLSLTLTVSLWLSCPHLFAIALWPTVFPAPPPPL